MRSSDKGADTDQGSRQRYPRIYLGSALALTGLAALAAFHFKYDSAASMPAAAGGRTVPVVLYGSCPTPRYPDSSVAKATGVVMLNFLVGIDGTIVASQVETSSGHATLDEAARAALSLCKFRPGTLNGRPEQSWHIMKYDWSTAR